MIRSMKYPRGNVYLSGGMQFAKGFGSSWRAKCSEKLRAMGYFPIDVAELDAAYTKKHGQLYRGFDSDNILQKKSNIRKHFIHTDLELIISDSDVLVVLYNKSARLGAGTISECQIAERYDIPIFLVSVYKDWFNEVPGWLQALTTKIFTDFEELHRYLDRLPEGILRRDKYGNHRAIPGYYLCSLCGEPFAKNKTHFVSKVSPLYCSGCVEIVKQTYENHEDRYKFFIECLESQITKENEGELKFRTLSKR